MLPTSATDALANSKPHRRRGLEGHATGAGSGVMRLECTLPDRVQRTAVEFVPCEEIP